MFKKHIKLQPNNTNIKSVKAAFSKCLSHRDVSTRLHARSMVDYPDDKKQDQTLPIFDTVADQIQHSHSHFAFTAKHPLRTIQKESFNRSHSKGRMNFEKQANLPILKKPSQKNALNETSKRATTQADQNKLNLTRMKLNDNKENMELSQENRRLKIINQHLEEENKSLIDTLKKHEAREKSLTSQLKESGGCSEHLIIIQSLKKVIDSQLQKIIQLERQIIICSEKKQSERYREIDKIRKKPSIEQYTPSFPPSSPNKRKPLDESNNSTEEDMNLYIEYVDTFRREKQKEEEEMEMEKNRNRLQCRQRIDNLTIEVVPQATDADELLCEIDDCLDSLSRRRRQVL